MRHITVQKHDAHTFIKHFSSGPGHSHTDSFQISRFEQAGKTLNGLCWCIMSAMF